MDRWNCVLRTVARIKPFKDVHLLEGAWLDKLFKSTITSIKDIVIVPAVPVHKAIVKHHIDGTLDIKPVPAQ